MLLLTTYVPSYHKVVTDAITKGMNIQMNAKNMLAELLQSEMKRGGLSQRDMAKKLDVSQKALQNWMNAEGTPRLRTSSLIKLSDALNLDIKSLAALVSPIHAHDASVESQIRAQQIDKLPPNLVNAIDAIIMAGLKQIEDSINDTDT